ncbi:MAG: CDC48 family AAA ATPase [Chloroflexota bacterium]|nr:CDC48 family AAA ATPase [Chloroflexota bacterium]
MNAREGHVLVLTLAEARATDVGRGIARIDPKDVASLGLEVGEVILVRGKRPAPVRVMPAYPQERGKGIIQIDGITRENAQAGLGDQVQVEKTPHQAAAVIVLAPGASSKAFAQSGSARQLGRVLEGLPVTRGDRVRASLLGGRHLEFTVADTRPEGVVLVGPGTVVKVGEEGAPTREKAGFTYEDIGGLRKEVQRIREMVELPLKHPELFERLGIGAPKGVLVHGPPGCGKTLIARAVASETDAAFFHISGPEVIHKFYGESEAHLRAIFEKAREQAPSIIFIDEIDAIASKREDVRGDQQVERRVVAQLLALMDGLKDRGQVIVIGATNIPNVLDPALRRPGRFDREIAISVPDRNGRLEILQIHTRGMPLAEDVNLERLAEVTHGFVGADLEALCREAAMTTLRKTVPQMRLDDGYLSEDALLNLKVTMDDFKGALKEVEPSAIREIFTEVPDVGWEDIGGLEEAKKALKEAVEWPLKYSDLFTQMGARPPKGVLLSGLPGTGKTLLAKAVASQSGVNFISVKGPALLSKWVGESEKAVREVFRKARQASPCIVFFDELDALAPARGTGHDSAVTDRVNSQLLTELDGIEELRGVVVLAATNRPDLVDPALRRAGRFDIQIELPPPDELARREVFAIHTRRMPLAEDLNLDAMARQTEGMTGADIEAVCQQACLGAIRECVERGLTETGVGRLNVTAEHFRQALDHRARDRR